MALSTALTLYKEKTNCFIQQYSNFSVKEVAQTLNGINTQGENIADNGGVIQSYRAYQKYVLENGAEPQLPAIDLSPEQLFWVSSAVQYCSKATKQYLTLQVVTDSHSPSRQRVNGVVSNSDEFSKVFNCPSGAPMNPVNKCVICIQLSVRCAHESGQQVCHLALEMFGNVVKEFKRSLIANKWMGNETLVHALQKLDKMRLLVGYPDELLNETYITDYYRTLWTNATDYFGNNVRLSKWYLDLGFGKLRLPVDQYDWKELSGVAVVNAYYHQLKNLVVMPAGILQGVFFNKDRPNYLNYGSIAYVSGHEIIHGFDDGGRQYDSSGNLRNWWDSQTDALYKEKTNCFIQQYSNFSVKEVAQTLNGINTQGENIADNGGVIQSY
ncbi:unnamed protein product, partial [Medioppia subpectinata]